MGVGLAVGGLALLRRLGPADLPRLQDIDLDAGVLAFALLLSLGSGLALGLLPLARAWRLDLCAALKEGGQGTGAGFDPIFIEDFPLPEGQQGPIKRFKWIGGGYHEAMGNPVVAGRAITWDDIRELARVVMITEGFARELWGDPARALGRRIATGFGPGNWREIVGVVGDVRDDGLDKDPVDIVYWPMAIRDYWPEISGRNSLFVQRTMTYVVRSGRTGTPGFFVEVRREVLATFPGRPLVGVRTMASLERDSLASTSFTLVMLAIAAAMAPPCEAVHAPA